MDFLLVRSSRARREENSMKNPATVIVAICLLTAFPKGAVAQDADPMAGFPSLDSATAATQAAQEAKQAANLDLDQLASMDVKVTSASKKSENLFSAPAAIYVLSGEQILRGGFSSVPDALRSVPGLYVAQEDSHSWIVAARGFSYAFNDKMLVLLDGRLLYDPLFGGVYWDTFDPPLGDIDRIEIILGPGGTLWGANAVNGVINIITKNSQKTQGLAVAASAGIDERDKASLRYGGGIGQNLSYRIFAQGMYGDPTVDASGTPQPDQWNLQQGGLRLDWSLSSRDNFSLEGGGYDGAIQVAELNFSGPSAAGPTEPQQDVAMKGGNIEGRWKHHFSDRSSTDLLAYCNWFDRFDTLGGDVRNTCDVEVQHDFIFTPRHSLIWGGSMLSTVDTPSDNFEISYTPARERDTTYSAFGQYEIAAVPDRLRFIGGAKLEHNAYTGFEIQPQIRGVWTPSQSATLWGAVSRAVREPTRVNTDVDLKVSETLGGPLPVFAAITGNPALHSEAVRAYELGSRYLVKPGFSFDLAAFYNHYDQLINVGPPGPPEVLSSYIEIPLQFRNSGTGQTHGLGLFTELRPVGRWSLSAGLTETRGVATAGTEGVDTPRHILNLQSRLDLTRHFNFDANYYYYDAISELKLPPLNRVDVGFSSNRISGFTLSIWGRNLQSAHHLENNTGEPYFPAGEVRRALVLELMWRSSTE